MRTTQWLGTAVTPLAVALVPVVSMWASNSGEVDAATVVVPLGLSVGLAAFMWGAAWMVLRRASAATAVASVGLILFFGYGRWIQALIDSGLGLNQADALLASLCAVLVVAVAYATKRIEVDILLLGLGVAAGSMLAMSSAQIWLSGAVSGGSSGDEVDLARFAPSDAGPPMESSRLDSADTPDIYFIVLDGYARHDVLQTGFKHDNSGFLAKLEERGFYVARESASNYTLTHLSLSSSLNGVYMDGVIDAIGRDREAKTPFYGLVRANWVGRFLRARGYQYAQVYTNWGGTETSDIADLGYRFVPRWLGSEFAYVLAGTTALHRLRPTVAGFHLFGLDAIERVSRVDGPTFLLAHLLLPHDPYVFGRDGSVRAEVPLHLRHDIETKRQVAGSDPTRAYVDQLVFLNGEILEVIDHLLEHSPVEPVIIIQGDHGWSSSLPRSFSAKRRRAHRIRSRAAILNAFRVPESVERKLYSGITPVNTFRLLFAELFGADLALLPDRTYYSWYTAPFDFVDVTGLMREEP
jgi:hypothetical protein